MINHDNYRLANETLYIDFFQTTDDPNKWTRHRNTKSDNIDGYTEDGLEVFSTKQLTSNPENEGKLAIVSGHFSIPGLILIIKKGKIIPAKISNIGETKRDKINKEEGKMKGTIKWNSFTTQKNI